MFSVQRCIFDLLVPPRVLWFKQRKPEVTMAKRQGNRILIKMKSTESSHHYHTEKNRQNHPDRLELKKFDPTLRKHVLYREDR